MFFGIIYSENRLGENFMADVYKFRVKLQELEKYLWRDMEYFCYFLHIFLLFSWVIIVHLGIFTF